MARKACEQADSSEWNPRNVGRLARRNGTLGMSYIMQIPTRG